VPSGVSSHKNVPRIVLDTTSVEKRHDLLDKTDFPVVLLVIPNVPFYLLDV